MTPRSWQIRRGDDYGDDALDRCDDHRNVCRRSIQRAVGIASELELSLRGQELYSAAPPEKHRTDRPRISRESNWSSIAGGPNLITLDVSTGETSAKAIEWKSAISVTS